MKGPEPTASDTGLEASRRASLAGIMTGIWWPERPRASMTKANGRRRCITKCFASMGRKSATASIMAPPKGSRLAHRSIEATQSSDVTGVPSLQASPSRSVKV